MTSGTADWGVGVCLTQTFRVFDLGRKLMSGSEHASVLLVEYSEQLRTEYTAHLTEAGYRVTAVDASVLALDHLRHHGAWVMVVNIGLPGMSGGDLIKEAVETDPDLAIIALSVVNDAAIAAHCMRRGAMDFLIKPVELSHLDAAIRRAVKRRESLQGERAATAKVRVELEGQMALLEIELQRREEMARATLESLVTALENKTHYLGGHSGRVSTLAATVAEKLGMSDEEIGQVRLAGQLHDVGMIGVKEEIANKTGPLNDEEYEHVRRHVVIGAQILKPLTHLGPVLEFIRNHHERWDGAGYPAGSVGNTIPLGGRIVAAAEVYDALCSERPYRSRFTSADAVGHVRSLGGLNLDPAVSDALAAVVLERRPSIRGVDEGERGLGVL